MEQQSSFDRSENRDPATPIFYSALQRTVSQIGQIADKGGMLDREQACHWLVARQREGKFKMEELEWSGLKDWLTAASGKVAVADIEAFARNNGVQVKEVVKGSDVDWAVYDPEAREEYYFPTEAEARQYAQENFIPSVEVFPKKDRGEVTVYEKYALPGGENYRELLLMLPEGGGEPKPEPLTKLPDGYTTIYDRTQPYGYQWAVVREDASHARPLFNRLVNEEVAIRDAISNLNYQREQEWREKGHKYRSSHWNEPNVIAHIRFNDRTDADGKRVLFIEELQSDWGQEGKRKGFRSLKPTKPDLEAKGVSFEQVNGKWEAYFETAQIAEADTIEEAIRQVLEETELDFVKIVDGVPAAPFVTDTKSWLSLGIKRMIRYAAENGYDRIAFVNGEQSADRYDLSKQISRIEWTRQGNKFTIKAYSTDEPDSRRPTIEKSDMTAVELEDVIGKEVAKRVVDQSEGASQTPDYEIYDPQPSDIRPSWLVEHKGSGHIRPFSSRAAADAYVADRSKGNIAKGELSGIDLKVGGEGMRTFYDKIVPQVANDVLKRLGGGKSVRVDISRNVAANAEPDIFGDTDGDFIDTTRQFGFDITPAMRTQALSGLPLFSKRIEQTTTKEFRTWFDKSKIVDEEGRPVVVYHGTAASFDQFNPKLLGSISEASDAKVGFWFAGNPRRAALAAYDAQDVSTDDSGANVMPVYLKMLNPYESYESVYELLADPEASAKLIRRARRAGHDGVIFHNGEMGTNYVVFNPRQIKSAIGNVGSFDVADPDIRRSESVGSAGISVADVEKALAPLQAKWLGFRRIRIARTLADLDAAVRDRVRIDSGTEGIFDPVTNSVYLIADRLATPARAVWVAAHEVVGHAGLRMLKDRRVNEAVSLAGKNPFVRQLAVAISQDRKIEFDDRCIEEAIAELAAAMETDDIKALRDRYQVDIPMAALNGIQGAIGRVLEAIKRFLSSVMRRPVSEVSDADVRGIIRASRAAVEMGQETAPVADGELALASEKAPAFYSALQRAIPQMTHISDKQGMVNAEQASLWLAARQKEGKFKAEELEWSGLTDWLAAAGGKVSVSDIEQFVQGNGIQIQEKMKGESGLDSGGDLFVGQNYDYKGNPDGWAIFKEGDDDDPVGGTYKSREDAEAALALMNDAQPTKYGKYTLPGGEDYRELLLTLPVQDATGRYTDYMAQLERKYGEMTSSDWLKDISKDESAELDRLEKLMGAESLDQIKSYHSSHWDEPNIVAHVRFNSRTDADGNKVLFIEEIQSDWAQEGKKKGFKGDPMPAFDAWSAFVDKMSEKYRVTGGALFTVMDDADRAEYSRLYTAKEKERNRGGDQIQRAPFVSDTKAWVSLALKRMIRYAAEIGFDKIAFVNGEQSADRYDLSKEISRIIVKPQRAERGEYGLQAFDLGGNTVMKKDAVQLADLDDIIGKEAADKARKQMYDYGIADLKGLDLKVGGEGMRTFYDKIVPQVANDVLKRLGGGKICAIQVVTGYADTDAGGGFMIRNPNATLRTTQTGFNITPELRERALAGLPLFSKRSDQTTTAAFRAWFAESKALDENGKPRVLYHGTKEEFTKFSRFYIDDDEEHGFFFSTNPEVANEYAGDARGIGGNVMPVYLSIQNPYRVTKEQWLNAEGLSPKEAMKAGYDGYIVSGMNRGSDTSDTYIAFYPNQIKSAIGNSGDFDPANADIRFSLAAAPAGTLTVPVDADINNRPARRMKA